MLKIAFFIFLAGLFPDKGVLSIRCEPGTEVWWEGVRLGQTDSNGVLRIQDIPPGVFSLTLKKEGFRELNATVEVTAGDRLLSFELESVPQMPPRVAQRVDNRRKAVKEGTKRRATKPEAKREPKKTARVAGEKVQMGPSDQPEVLTVKPPDSERTESSYPVEAYLLAAALLGGAFYSFKKYKIRHASLVQQRVSATLAQDTEMRQPEQGSQPIVSPLTDGFLEDLRRREKMIEEGIDIVPARRGRVIDLEAAEIRKIEEES